VNAESDFQVPTGFDFAHEEWLSRGGKEFRRKYAGADFDYYETRYWALVRQAVLARDSATCFSCQGSAGYVHHLSYNFTGEDHLHPETLVSVCGQCHQMVEYARLAESLMSKMRRRFSLCTGFLEDRRGCLDQNAAHVYARLLEYQDELAELQTLFATGTPYTNPRIKSEAEAEVVVSRFRQERQAYEEQAADLVSAWEGSEKEKAERFLPMLTLEIQKCQKFAAEVLKPVSPRARQSERARPAEAVSESGSKASEVEALVVGIKFHRGNANGIASGEKVQLAREPNNAYDPSAIRVNLKTGETLGYLTKEVAAVFAKQLDAGGDVQAQVSKIVRDEGVPVCVRLSRHTAEPIDDVVRRTSGNRVESGCGLPESDYSRQPKYEPKPCNDSSRMKDSLCRWNTVDGPNAGLFDNPNSARPCLIK